MSSLPAQPLRIPPALRPVVRALAKRVIQATPDHWEQLNHQLDSGTDISHGGYLLEWFLSPAFSEVTSLSEDMKSECKTHFGTEFDHRVVMALSHAVVGEMYARGRRAAGRRRYQW